MRSLFCLLLLCLGILGAISTSTSPEKTEKLSGLTSSSSSTSTSTKRAASSRISNIVVLMMENHSFDSLLGYLKQDFNSNIDGISPSMQQPRDPSDLSKGFISISRGGQDVPPDDPAHDFNNIAIQMNNNLMNGFVFDSIKNGLNESNPVDLFDSTTAPIINTLAKEYAVFDAWFASIPGPTDPNRQFAMSGTSLGVLNNFNGTLYPQQTYFDYLSTYNKTWRGYYQEDLWCFGYFEDLLKPENSGNIYDLESHFFSDVANGALPYFSWLQPQMNVRLRGKLPTWQHPDASLSEGEGLIKQVYESLRSGPKWNETLFIITYDEHGGFFDHVSPPDEGVPPPDNNVNKNGFKFDRLGVRLPTIAISPWISRGTLISSYIEGERPTSTSAFDSTSILSTSNIIMSLSDAPPLSNRMKWANTFASIVEVLDTPRSDCVETLPPIYTDKSKKLRAFERQRAKPLNEHLESQLIYYCSMHYPIEHKGGMCPGRRELKYNQGLASDWIYEEQRRLLDRLERERREKREKK